MNGSTRIRLVLAALLTASTAGAQAASSKGFFLTGSEFGSGGSTLSSRFDLTGSFGNGVVADRTGSQAFTLTGGFVASIDSSSTGRPWVTGVRPERAARNAATPLTLHGTELHLGPAATVRIGGRLAATTSRTRDTIQTVLPPNVAPGWQPVEVTTGSSTTVLNRAVGVLPMMDLERPATSGVPFRISFQGTQGDSVMWAASAGRLPFAIPLPPFGHGLELDPATMLVITVTAVTDPDGTFHLPLPGQAWVGPIYVQGLAVSSHAGYGPATFTNVVVLR